MRGDIVLLVISLLCRISVATDKLAFVFELVRHGARSTGSPDPGYFLVPPGMLTASGMRQRLLLGQYNRQRYIDKYGLLDDTYNPDQIWVQCTGYFRTLQSSYSELLGLYPPSTVSSNSHHNEDSSILPEKGLPPIVIRGHANNLESFVENLQLIPVYSYGPQSAPEDDEYFVGCMYAWAVKTFYESYNNTFDSLNGLIAPIVKESIGIAFNLSEEQMKNFNYRTAAAHHDAIKCENFDGYPRRYNFSGEEYYYIRLIQNYSLTIPIGDYGRQLAVTRELRRPIQIMKDKVKQVLANTTKHDDLKFLLYSTHDDSLSNTLLFLRPLDSDQFVDIPFATTMYLELHYDDECVTVSNSTACFTVHASYNNTPLKFQSCLDANKARGSQSPFCLFDDFIAHYDSVKFTGDVDTACAQTFVPPTAF